MGAQTQRSAATTVGLSSRRQTAPLKVLLLVAQAAPLKALLLVAQAAPLKALLLVARAVAGCRGLGAADEGGKGGVQQNGRVDEHGSLCLVVVVVVNVRP